MTSARLTAVGVIARRVCLLYVCWLGFLATHEFGHVVHAWTSGGHVKRVVIPLVGFSRTDVSPNPWPQWVVWGGAVWGVIIPLILFAITLRRPRRLRTFAAFFAGFCLIGNGAYLAAGSRMSAGDAADLVRLGAPPALLIGVGVPMAMTGLWLWHRTPAAFRWSAS